MYMHQPSGLNLTLFRAYDPNTAKWLSRDLAGEIETDDGDGGTVGGLNLYGYVDNDPMDYTDIAGLGKGGRRNLTVNQGGQQLTVKTPLSDIQKALAEAKAAGMSAAHIKALTGLAKVVSRGGSMCLEPLAAGTAIYYASKGDSNAAIDSMLLNIPTTVATTLGPMFRPTPGGPPPSSPYTNGSAANSAPMNPTPPSP
jgi:RHS repeat-associated protein